MSDSSSRAAGIAALDWVGGALRRNPEGLLLLGAGIALLLRSGASSAIAEASARIAEAEDRAGAATGEISEGVAQPVGEGIAQAMDSAQPAVGTATSYVDQGMDRVRSAAEMAKSYADQAKASGQSAAGAARSYADEAMESGKSAAEMAKSYLDQAMDGARTAAERTRSSLSAASAYAERARATITEQSAWLKEQSQTAFNQGAQIFRDQPLAFAALGVGVGMALGALLPRTGIEERVVGPARNTLAGSARGAGDRVVRATGVAGSELLHAIKKRGFDEAGMKEMVNEVANSFTGALGEQNHAQREDRPEARDGGGAGDRTMAPAAS